MISLFDRFTFEPMTRGYVSLRRLVSRCDETRWFCTAGSEFGLWFCTLNGFGLHFEVIGPFEVTTKWPGLLAAVLSGLALACYLTDGFHVCD